MYNAAVWLRESASDLNEQLHPHWRSFPLEQVNSQEESAPKFWEKSPQEAKSLRAFMAAEAVRDQGEEVFQEFILRLLTAVHKDKKPIDSEETIRDVAAQVPGLDVQRLEQDMQKQEYRQRIQRDYTEAVDQHGIFGTPTLLFSGGDPVFLKMSPPAPRDQAGSLFEQVRAMSTERPYVQEMKKPRKPS